MKKNTNIRDEKLLNDLNKYIEELEYNLKGLEINLNIIQNGDELPYWNGDNANKYLKSVLSQIEKNKVLVDNLKKCSKSVK